VTGIDVSVIKDVTSVVIGKKKKKGIGWSFTVTPRYKEVKIKKGKGKKCSFDWLEKDSSGFPLGLLSYVNAINKFCQDLKDDKKLTPKHPCIRWSGSLNEWKKTIKAGGFLSLPDIWKAIKVFIKTGRSPTVDPILDYDNSKMDCRKSEEKKIDLFDRPFSLEWPHYKRTLKIRVVAKKRCSYGM